MRPAQQVAHMREAFKRADKLTRRSIVPVLPPSEVEFAGIRMFVDPRDNYTERCIWEKGEPPEMASLLALVERVEGKRAIVFDIGANCGAFTVPLAFAVAEGSRVIAFEPNPIMVGRLGHNVRLNNLGDVVRIESCALGAHSGEAKLNFHRGNFGQATLMPIKRRRWNAGHTVVPLRTLNEFTHRATDYDMSVLKIDVEGAEEQALKPLLDQGLGGWLPDVLLIETMHASEWSCDLVGALCGLGYAIGFQADGNTLLQKET